VIRDLADERITRQRVQPRGWRDYTLIRTPDCTLSAKEHFLAALLSKATGESTPADRNHRANSLLRPATKRAIDAHPRSLTLIRVQPKLELQAVSQDAPTATAIDCDEKAVRRAQIYALNSLLRQHHQAEWVAYKGKRQRQMSLVERCLQDGARVVALRGLRRWAERCTWIEEHQLQQVQEDARCQDQALAHCIAITTSNREDEDMVRSMPIDPFCGPQMTRFCPWHSTAAGCPRLSSCPLSHNQLPREAVSYKFRAWALFAHDGWLGESQNRPFARVYNL